MRQKFLFILIPLIGLLTNYSVAQNPDFNVTQVSHVPFAEGCNDVWGIVDTAGVEYAIIGTRTATVVLNLENPAAPQQVYRVDGTNTTWRDIKNWEQYAYSVCDDCPDGLVIINMTDPANINHKIVTTIPDMTDGGAELLGAVHNIWVDEFGYLYLSGADQNDGGLVIIDVATDPWNPVIVGYGPFRYSHDVYVRDNLAYSSDIDDGFFSVLDVSDKSNIVELATQQTLSTFTHNAWLSDDSDYLFTTDERDFAFIEAYDVSDVTDIRRVDVYRPPSTEGLPVTPHNAHVFNDYIIVSYYTDGMKIIDAQYPDNLTEVGSFDTWFNGTGGTNGNWGAFPFLPSGLILISDMITGLHVLQPNYVRASYLEGTVRNEDGMAIPNVQVDILGTQPNLNSTSNFGTYKTGIAEEGSLDVMFSHPLYRDTVVTVPLASDSITMLDMTLRFLFARVAHSGTLSDKEGNPISNSVVTYESDNIDYNFTTDAGGMFSGTLFDLEYEVSAGVWGYGDTVFAITDASTGVDIVLPGTGNLYLDRFVADQGWSVINNAETGDWERGVPQGTDFQGPLNPGEDSPADIGDKCYGTGLNSQTPFDNDVDGVYNFLTSPVIELDELVHGIRLNFDYWYRTVDVQGPSNDTLEVDIIVDGTSVGRMEAITESDPTWRSYASVNLLDILQLPNDGQLQVRFIIGDAEPPGAPLEAAIDNVLISVERASGTQTTAAKDVSISVFPNPVVDRLFIDLKNFEGVIERLDVFNAQGQIVQSQLVESLNNSIEFNHSPGLYTILLYDKNGAKYSELIMKN